MSTSAADAPKDGELLPFHRSWKVATWTAVTMILLALFGVGLTTTSSTFAPTYWVLLVPVYGLLCIGTAYLRTGHGKTLDRMAVVRQLAHWVGVSIALGLDFYVRGSGEETGIASGLNAMIVLALGCYLAGVHLETLFLPVGGLLTLVLIIVAKADQYLWVVFVVGGVTAAVLLWLERWFTKKAR
jgi:hypothetical protein